MEFRKRVAAVALAVAALGATVLMAAPAGSAQFAGVNGRIQYSKVNAGAPRSASVHLVNPDGTGDVTVVADGWWASQDAAATKLSYVTSDGATLHVSNFDGTGATTIHTAASGNSLAATSMSPDGTKVAYVDRGQSTDLYVINVDGSGRTNLTNGAASYPTWPQFSPDGTRILFMAQTGTPGTRQISVIPATGGSVTVVATGNYSWPSWTPDGKILAELAVNSAQSIVRMNADGSGQTTLLTAASLGMTQLYWPVASPDGTKFTFSAGAGNQANSRSVASFDPAVNQTALSLWTANIDGSGATRIVDSADGADRALAIWSSNGGVPTTTTTVPAEPAAPKYTG